MALEPAQLKSSGSCCSRHSACSTEKAGKRWLVSASRPSHWNSSLGEREGGGVKRLGVEGSDRVVATVAEKVTGCVSVKVLAKK